MSKKPFPLINVLTTQSDLRDLSQVPLMVDFVSKGGSFKLKNLTIWSMGHGGKKNPPLIALTRFPDGHVIAHDGHHRIVSALLAGRQFLNHNEYIIKDFTYEEYMEINFDQSYVTPFDPRTQIRLWDFKAFKAHVMELYKTNPDEARAYIVAHPELYRNDRDIRTVDDLAQRVKCRINAIAAGTSEMPCLIPKNLSIAIVESLDQAET